MKLQLDNESLRTIIPNIIHEVEGETPLLDKLRPWIESSQMWVETYFIGSIEPPSRPLQTLATKIIVYKAFADAVPSLDVVMSPAGFAVINTDGRAPASKERIERLVASLNSYVETNLASLLRGMARSVEWRNSPVGIYWLGTFIPNIDVASHFARPKHYDLLAFYNSARVFAEYFEHELAVSYLGSDFLSFIRGGYPDFSTLGVKEIYTRIASAEMKYVSFRMSGQSDCMSPCNTHIPDSQGNHEIWHLARPIIAQLCYWPELESLWKNEMGERLKVEPFRNTMHGGYFF